MCKINGHSIFTYAAQPWNASKLYTSEKRASAVQKAQADAAETIAKNTEGDEISSTASTAKINNKQKNYGIKLIFPMVLLFYELV